MADNNRWKPRREGNDPAWACQGKSAFATKGGAYEAIKNMRRAKHLRRPGQLEPYRCPFCHHWHIGSDR